MAAKVITIRIPEAKVAVALQGYLKAHPNNETIPDPEWVNPGDGSAAPHIAKYTNAAWVNESVRRDIIRDIRRGLQELANEAAQVTTDDDIVELG